MTTGKMPPLVILCGGMGVRIREVSDLRPKPMVEVGEFPIVWHIMKSYSAFGVNRFILCLGYMKEVFIDYFINYRARAGDVTVELGSPDKLIFHSSYYEELEWSVTLADTGLHTQTGGRIARAVSKYLPEDENDFFMTYGDAVADININALYRLHRQSDALATISAVHPSGRFGEMQINGSDVVDFNEKPQANEGYINGGFMVLTRKFVDDYLDTQTDTVLEGKPLQNATGDNRVTAYKHDGFWQCMDTPREHKLLNELWTQHNAPWCKHWKRGDV